jgi:hypothetical protein
MFIGVPAQDTDENMHRFVDQHSLEDDHHLVDDDGDIWGRFGVAYQPAWVFVSPDGDTDVVAGALFEEALFERLDELVGAP